MSYSEPNLEVDSSKTQYLFNAYRTNRGTIEATFAMLKYFNWTKGNIIHDNNYQKVFNMSLKIMEWLLQNDLYCSNLSSKLFNYSIIHNCMCNITIELQTY